jgi:hypothetical protein
LCYKKKKVQKVLYSGFSRHLHLLAFGAL